MKSSVGPCFGSNRLALLWTGLLLIPFTLPTTTRAQSSALQFVPVTPCRVVDTRNPTGDFGGPALVARSTRTFNIPQSSCGIPATAVAYSLNATALPDSSLGFLIMWPAGQPRPSVSTLNTFNGRVKANAAITTSGTDGGVSVYTTDATQFILDINGYFVPADVSVPSLQFFPVTPCRVADTRVAAGPLGAPTIGHGETRSFPIQSGSCGIPATAQAYSLNVTAIPREGVLRYLTSWPSGQAQPLVSTLNSSTQDVTANAAIVAAGTGGGVSIFVSNSADVVLDINGYFAPAASGGLSLYTLTQCRAFDSRSSGTGPVPAHGTLAVPVQDSPCAPPGTAQAYVLNATVVPSSALGYLTLWADGTARPVVSTLNSDEGLTNSNMAIVSNTIGTIDAYSTDMTNLIFDLSGYFAP